MSEYQYYHFQTIDKPLSKRQVDALRTISTRARITPTSFVNEYNWGNLNADPVTMMWRWFDVHVYVTNWMTRCPARRWLRRCGHGNAPRFRSGMAGSTSARA
jgi:hypothetical protein